MEKTHIESAWKNRLEDGMLWQYIEPDGRKPGYFRYLLSDIGPQEEIRFYASPMIGGQMHMTTASFVLLDWKTRDQPAQLDITDDETTRAIWDVLLDLLDVQYCSWISSHP